MSALQLADAKAHLNINVDTFDVKLQATIDAAEARLGQEIGPLTPADRTDRVAGGGPFLLLPSVPVGRLTSVIPAGPDPDPVDVGVLFLDGPAGTVRFLDGSKFYWAAYMVSYQAGWSSVPNDVMFAIKEEVRHLWQTQRGSTVSPDGGAALPQVGYALPNRVIEMIAPYRYSVVG